jgi:hypothetical protein
MPGSYAHIALVNLASEKAKLKKINTFPEEAIDAANLHLNFLELGSISPDYPYLDITSADSKKWADEMHYTHTCKAISAGADQVRGLAPGIVKDKCLAWLMGYTAHVITDMCIHPVVELKVGPYKGNETQHRRCEMHQDVYIFRRIGASMPQISNHLNATVLTCGINNEPGKLDEDIERLWTGILRNVYETEFNNNKPDIDKWHYKCREILQKLLPTTSRFVSFARHVCDGLGLYYPTYDEIDKTYIENLEAPDGKLMHYDAIFNSAIMQVQKTWLDVVKYALGQNVDIAFHNDEWNLDTGRNTLGGQNNLVFWEVS